MMIDRRGGSSFDGTTPTGECHLNGRKIRVDALPEHLEYQDGGCELAPSCLRCPLERCRYDQPGGARKLMQGSRDDALCRRREDGLGIQALAAEFGVSRRTVFRILAAGRSENVGVRRQEFQVRSSTFEARLTAGRRSWAAYNAV